MTTEWIRFGISAFFAAIGLFAFLSAMIGVCRFKFLLNRLHAAAVADTLGISCIMLSCVIYIGIDFVSLKELIVVLLMAFTSPVGTHLLSDIEFKTSKRLTKECRVTDDVNAEREGFDGAD